MKIYLYRMTISDPKMMYKTVYVLAPSSEHAKLEVGRHVPSNGIGQKWIRDCVRVGEPEKNLYVGGIE